MPSIFCLILALATLPTFADEPIDRNYQWPQWRGPSADGVAPHANPPLTWSETENVKWKIEIPGAGSSTPIIWDDKLFLLTAIQTDRKDESLPAPEDQPERQFGIVFPNQFHEFVVLCLNRNTGDEIWRKVVHEEVPHEGHHPDNDYASASPVTDGRHLYVSFGSRGVYCLDLDGNVKWERDLGQLDTRRSFGEGSSPALYGDTLVTVWDHEGQSFIEALDATTGDTRWKQERDEPSAWATPYVIERDGRAQVVTNASNAVRSYDLTTGELLWQCAGQVGNVTPCPVATEKLVFCMSGFRGSALFALPLDQTGDLTGTEKIAWSKDRGTPYIPSPLLWDDRLYFTQGNEGILTCLDASTGETVIDRTRLPGISKIYASPVGAAGRIYLTSRDGQTLVIRHGTEFEELASNKLDDYEFDASPVRRYR